jgi:DNA modification methylase
MPSAEELLDGKSYVVLEGDCREILPTITGKVDHVITDPPYGEHVHRNGLRLNSAGQMSAKKRRRDISKLPDVDGAACRKHRSIELGFESLADDLRTSCAQEFARLASRWTLVFSDVEGADGWRHELTGCGLDFVRYGFWVKDRAMPQLTGDRPGSRVEQITIAHPKGRKRWNGGGLGNVWQHPIVANCNGHRSDRVHTTQKPLSLMLELVELFTSPGDVILDPFSGSATTALAALRLGRRCIAIERDPRYAALSRDRLQAEAQSSTLQAHRAGQLPLIPRG